MSDALSMSKIAGDTTSKAIDIINKFKYGKQQAEAASANGNWTVHMQNQLMNALNGSATTDAACGRTN